LKKAAGTSPKDGAGGGADSSWDAFGAGAEGSGTGSGGAAGEAPGPWDAFGESPTGGASSGSEGSGWDLVNDSPEDKRQPNPHWEGQPRDRSQSGKSVDDILEELQNVV
jgi:hypothetical protein